METSPGGFFLGLTVITVHYIVRAISFLIAMQKKIWISVVILLILMVGAFWVTSKRESQNALRESVATEVISEASKFVTDVDPDVNHWQTKETDFFTIKFPKEWYWLESDLEKTGYHSRIITNNAEFPINKYADIGLGISGNYPLDLSNDTEVIGSFRASATSDEGVPGQSSDSTLRSIQDQFPSAECYSLSTPEEFPVRSFCSYIVNDKQKIYAYSIMNKSLRIFFVFRTTENSLAKKDILDKIAENIKIYEK